jgi:hypothetical protein
MSRTTFMVAFAILACASVVMAVDISRTQRRSEASLEATSTVATKYSLPNHRYVSFRCVCFIVKLLSCTCSHTNN